MVTRVRTCCDAGSSKIVLLICIYIMRLVAEHNLDLLAALGANLPSLKVICLFWKGTAQCKGVTPQPTLPNSNFTSQRLPVYIAIR